MQIDRNAEFEYMKKFIVDNDFGPGSETMRDQLVSLWTAYCIHNNLEPDTSEYDSDLSELWNCFTEKPSWPWHCVNGFEGFMCRHLVRKEKMNDRQRIKQ